jgi:hemerythrin-like domain-containing protein
MAELAKFFTEDHRACDRAWAAVEAAVDAGDAEQVAVLFHAFDAAMRRHLSWEEDVMFPAFERATGMTHGPTTVMRREHGQMRGMLDQMKAALDGGDPDLVGDLGDTLLMLIQQHNMKEEHMLYPMAERALSPTWTLLQTQLA